MIRGAIELLKTIHPRLQNQDETIHIRHIHCPGCMCATRSLELSQRNPSVDEGQFWSRQARVTWLKGWMFKGFIVAA